MTDTAASPPAHPPLPQPLPRALDTACDALRGGDLPPVPLFGPGAQENRLPGGLLLHAAPELRAAGQWSSPAGRFCALDIRIEVPGRWLALHLPLPEPDLAGVRWLMLAVRTSAAEASVIRPCLRSGTPGGFRDDFLPRAILAQPRESDHHDILAPDRLPDLPLEAPWRELILFLPSATGTQLVLHDLRLVAA